MHSITILFILTLLLFFYAKSQPNCIFTHYSSENGLSQNSIMSMVQDHKRCSGDKPEMLQLMLEESGFRKRVSFDKVGILIKALPACRSQQSFHFPPQGFDQPSGWSQDDAPLSFYSSLTLSIGTNRIPPYSDKVLLLVERTAYLFKFCNNTFPFST